MKDLAEENRVCILDASRVYQLTPAVAPNESHTVDLHAFHPDTCLNLYEKAIKSCFSYQSWDPWSFITFNLPGTGFK